jgi:hypothetical protein
MMIVVTLTTVWTGLAYIWDNSKFIRELYERFTAGS